MQLLKVLGCIFLAGCLLIDTVDAISCFECNSENDLDCASNPTVSPAKQCEEKDTRCFTAKYNGNILRGCESDIPTECKDGNKCNEKYCIYSGCNRVSEPTLRCLQCRGDMECAMGLFVSPKLCENFAEGDQCYTYVFSEHNVTRGCVSDENAQCYGDYCKKCVGPACNRDTSFAEYECNQCDGNTKDCMGQSSEADVCTFAAPKKTKLLLNRKPGCFTYIKMNEFKRGFMQDINESFDINLLKTCETPNCNTECVTNCYECDSEKNPKCKTQLDELDKEPCFGTSQCHECENERSITRGCSRNTNPACVNCRNDPFCNKNTVNTCISCNSEKDQSCVVIPDVSKQNKTECDSFHDTCISKIINTSTVRGCSKQIGPCDNAKTCKSCTTNLCNKDMVPADRVSCHQCNDDTNCPKKQSAAADACKQYSEVNTKCFSLKENNNVIRGCESDKDHEICNKPGNNCLYCGNAAGCNSLIAETKSKCIVCNDGDQCGWAQKADKAVECIFDFMEPSCFTQISNDQKTVIRGCATKDTCSDPNSNCIKCTGDACNTKAITFQTCVRCDSSIDPNCVEGKETTPINCTAKETNFDDRGCYTIREDEKIRRGCITELTERDAEVCHTTDNKFCKLCTGQGCNNEAAPVGGKTFLNCVVCGPDDRQCIWGQPKESAVRCEFARFHTGCFSYQHKNGAVIRGCSNDKFACASDDENCNICEEDGCNNASFAHQECYQCTSTPEENEAGCGEIPAESLIKNCSLEFQTYEDRGCYTQRDNKIVTRGCLMDLEEEKWNTCKNDTERKKCDICMEPECNNKKAPNSGSVLAHFSFLTLIFITGLIIMNN